jgi:ribonuclease E
VAEVTSLGLVQMTRKRVGQGLFEAFSETCECCNGRGVHIRTEPVESRGGSGADSGAGDRKPGRGKGGRQSAATTAPKPSAPRPGPPPPGDAVAAAQAPALDVADAGADPVALHASAAPAGSPDRPASTEQGGPTEATEPARPAAGPVDGADASPVAVEDPVEPAGAGPEGSEAEDAEVRGGTDQPEEAPRRRRRSARSV